MAKPRITFGRIADYEPRPDRSETTVPIMRDGVTVGTLTREMHDEFVSRGSTDREWVVIAYEVYLNIGEDGMEQRFDVLRSGRGKVEDYEFGTGVAAGNAAKAYAREWLASFEAKPIREVEAPEGSQLWRDAAMERVKQRRREREERRHG